ncbi:hypothetical protein [Parasedimentitalea denitrificans]|nr:hypothetical protein [Sedimentitalea sp. CY04]
MDLLVVNWLLETSLHLETFARLNQYGGIIFNASFVGLPHPDKPDINKA